MKVIAKHENWILKEQCRKCVTTLAHSQKIEKTSEANLKKLSGTKELNPQERDKLLQLLTKYSTLFDGSLGKWKGSKVKLELKEGAQPYHAKAFPIPRIYMNTLKMEVDRLFKLGVLKKVNLS